MATGKTGNLLGSAKITATVLTVLSIFSSITQAALITVNGTNVSFTYDDSLLGLFGTPTVFGDS
ncbi:MAG: hypothetical protein PVJ66_06625, partial [Gammaproteobacteria bacterium]